MSRFEKTAKAIKETQAIEKLKNLPDGTVVPIPLDLINREHNIRRDSRHDQQGEFRQLVESIKEVGLLHQPVVTVVGHEIYCVSGHRRLAALEQLGQDKVPCVVRQFKSLDLKMAAQLLENTARKNLHPLDVADQLVRLKDAGYSQVRLQELLGKDRKTIGRFQKMAAWPKDVKDLILKHPDKIKAGLLLQLASREISDAELMAAVKKACGMIQGATAVDGSKPTGKARIMSQTLSYFKEQKLSARDQKIITDALKHLGLWQDKKASGVVLMARTPRREGRAAGRGR